MKIEIEVYKNQTISYDDDCDKFECQIEINNEVKNAKRQSLKELRKEIDLFIKANLEFKPFWFFHKSNYGKTFDVKFCSAIRTDGKFVVSNKDAGKYKSYLTSKELESAMVYDDEILKSRKELDDKFDQAKQDYTNGLEILFDKLIPYDLSSYISSE